MDLARQIATRRSGFLLFALTPPRVTVSAEQAQEIADVTRQRLAGLRPDGIVLYDIDDESDRNPEARPFPFLPTIDPAVFSARQLAGWDIPRIVYRAVGKYDEASLRDWLAEQDGARSLTVFVGAASRDARPTTSLARAQDVWAQTRPDLLLGGVAIPERHTRRGDEHVRLIGKQQAGCSFFVTQVVFDVNAAKDLVSDYRYACDERGLEPVPIVFTFSVCGSVKTLEFLRWLGVDVPRWIGNDLRQADDALQASFDLALAAAREIVGFCRRMQVPFGVNVESVSIRRAEIEASVALATRLRDLLGP